MANENIGVVTTEVTPVRGVVVFCGLPGAGKSTLCGKLVQLAKSENSAHLIHHVEFDKSLYDTDDASYKEKRRAILQTTETNIDTFLEENKTFVILLDDNMHLTSMRYEVYQMCRNKNIGFCIVYMQTSVDDCLLNNEKRLPLNSRIKPSVIENMASKLEIPNEKKNAFEEKTISVLDSKESAKSLMALILYAIKIPIHSNEIDINSKHTSRELTRKSVIHQCDNVLRKRVSIYTAAIQSDRNCYAKSLSKVKRVALDQIKKKIAEEEESKAKTPTIDQLLADSGNSSLEENEDCEMSKIEKWSQYAIQLFNAELENFEFPLLVV